MQNFLVYLGGDVEDVIAIILDVYYLRNVPFLHPVVPVGCPVLPYRLEWNMMKEVRWFSPKQITCLPKSTALIVTLVNIRIRTPNPRAG